jgi:phosphohistidine phosphatase
MDLIVWRHAEATDASLVGDDMARTLTSRGERQAARMATWLNQHLPATTRVLVSPAVRAQQTAAPLERRFKTMTALP